MIGRLPSFHRHAPPAPGNPPTGYKLQRGPLAGVWLAIDAVLQGHVDTITFSRGWRPGELDVILRLRSPVRTSKNRLDEEITRVVHIPSIGSVAAIESLATHLWEATAEFLLSSEVALRSREKQQLYEELTQVQGPKDPE